VSENQKSGRSLAGIAGIVAVATLISKLFGLIRQQAIAAAFGVGPAVDAYNYAYVIPGFLLVLLGGINGPFHSAIVSVLAKRDREDAAPLVETITTLVGGILLLVTIGLIIFANPLIDIVAPGLTETETGLEIREIAIQQFRIMAPMALLAGLIGIGFGTLNAADMYWLPSISPLFSSVALIAGLGILALNLGEDIVDPRYALVGGLVLAWGTLAGAILQWLAQVAAQWRSGLGTLRLRFEFARPGVKEVMRVMGPATLSSGMMQINVYTDLWFASFIPQTAAALGYAGLLVQTPLGILSNTILVPMLPVFSRLADPNDWPELKQRIRQGLVLTGLTMLPLGALMMALSLPIVRVVYERFAFDKGASEFVAAILMAYGLGMFVYLGRDVLVRVFYALGDGQTPFKISAINIVLNAVFDYLLINAFGAPGLVLATFSVNLISMLALLFLLDRKLNGLPLVQWMLPFFNLTIASFIAGTASWGILWGMQQVLGTEGFLIQLLQLCVAGLLGLVIFGAIATQLNLPEVDILVDRVRQKFGNHSGG
jgi:putative peptidoglycan lipid II flippase